MRTVGSRNQVKTDKGPRTGVREKGRNYSWNFTPAHWKVWLDRHNSAPEPQLVKGIQEFRDLLNK